MIGALTVEQLFDSMVAVRLDGPRAWSEKLTIDWSLTDLGQTYRTMVSNGAFIHFENLPSDDADLTLTLTKRDLPGVLGGGALDGVGQSGDSSVLRRLLGLLDAPDPDFAIVTP